MCGSSSDGKFNCCAPGGSWHTKCGSPPELYTWFQGKQACKGKATHTRIIFPHTTIRPKRISVSLMAHGRHKFRLRNFAKYVSPSLTVWNMHASSLPQYQNIRPLLIMFTYLTHFKHNHYTEQQLVATAATTATAATMTTTTTTLTDDQPGKHK